MQLSESERKVVVKMRKLDARWPKTRWIALAFSLGLIVVGIVHFFNFPESSILIGLGIANLYHISKAWKGPRAVRLLLKLMEEKKENSN